MSNENFLPEGYKAPSGGNYMKFKDGENRFRILSRPIIGYGDWQDKKPLRFRMDAKPLKSIDASKPVKHFWAMVVWNYNEEAIQILEVTQSSIQKAIQTLTADIDWGTPFDYDIKITRKGAGMETEYSINPVPHKKISDEIMVALSGKKINLEALFEGADPFVA